MGGLSCFRAVLLGIFIIVFVRAPCEAFLCGDNSNALVWPCTPFKSFWVFNEHIAYDQNIKHCSISFYFIYLCLFFPVKMLTICKNNMLLEWRVHGGHITAPLHCRKANQLKVILWFLLSILSFQCSSQQLRDWHLAWATLASAAHILSISCWDVDCD